MMHHKPSFHSSISPLRRLCGAVAVGAIVSAAQLGRTATTYVPVTTTIHNDNAAPNDLLFRSDGASQASYEDGGSRGQSMSSHVTSIGSWQLYIGGQTARRVWITLSHPVAGSPSAPAPDGYYSDSVELYSRCWDMNNTAIVWWEIPPPTSQNRCNFGLDFAYNRVKYKLVMGPSIPGLLDTAGTGWATVSCNAANGGACVNWSIVPNMIAGGGNVPTVANLYKFGKNGTFSLIGQ